MTLILIMRIVKSAISYYVTNTINLDQMLYTITSYQIQINVFYAKTDTQIVPYIFPCLLYDKLNETKVKVPTKLIVFRHT